MSSGPPEGKRGRVRVLIVALVCSYGLAYLVDEVLLGDMEDGIGFLGHLLLITVAFIGIASA